MKDGFVKIACGTPELKVADCGFNSEKITEMIRNASEMGVKIVCLPELSVCGYTCSDLFLQSALIASVRENLLKIAENTADLDIVSIVGAPIILRNKLYNCAVVMAHGEVLGVVPKLNLPNYSEFYEMRHFASGKGISGEIEFCGKTVHFGADQIFACRELPELTFGIEICEDLWVGDTPSTALASNGAAVIFNLSASDELIGKADYRRTIVKAKSGSTISVYAYADAGIGESTTDMTFAGHNIIAENGSVLAESKLFEGGILTADVDVKRIVSERVRCNTSGQATDFAMIPFSLKVTETALNRHFAQYPFVPSAKSELDERCDDILTIQTVGLLTRLRHIGCKDVVIGLSGGLDSTLAFIVCLRAFDRLGLDRNGIHAITMPCFGTTDRTYNNACQLARLCGATLEEINIADSVNLHFRDISHDSAVHDVTYENSQARERTQILMDKANQCNGIVIGTGDLSELALGWATYNGDHMSMYAVNASIPKTLVRWLVRYEAEISGTELRDILFDILDTPVSPELLPPEEDGTIAQKTEDLVGPYELHDFFLYYMVRLGYSPAKIFRIACLSFTNKYAPEIVLKWERKFYWRFFSQQFKRSCLPDGPKVGSVTLSPRSDFRMPSDACVALWQEELENIEKVD